MNRLFRTLRDLTGRSQRTFETEILPDALPDFDNRLVVLCSYAERASAYEDDLIDRYDQVMEHIDQFQALMEKALDDYRDRDALEYLRLAARLRPQRDLLDHELRAFHAVASDLLQRVTMLMENVEEARGFARSAELSPAATHSLDQTLTRLTRYFVLLERVTIARHRTLSQRLADEITNVVDDRLLDLELATFILNRRRALGPGRRSE